MHDRTMEAINRVREGLGNILQEHRVGLAKIGLTPEDIEADFDSSKRPPFPDGSRSAGQIGSSKGMPSAEPRDGIKVHHGAHGEVYELKAGVRARPH